MRTAILAVLLVTGAAPALAQLDRLTQRDALAGVRAASLQLLESLTDEEWQRTGTHSESGSYSVDDWLRTYAGHAHDHADQIRSSRRGEG